MTVKLTDAYHEVAKEADNPPPPDHHISLADTKRVISEYHRYLAQLPIDEAMNLIARGIASAKKQEQGEAARRHKPSKSRVS